MVVSNPDEIYKNYKLRRETKRGERKSKAKGGEHSVVSEKPDSGVSQLLDIAEWSSGRKQNIPGYFF